MARKNPRETIKVRRLPKVGDEIWIKATVTRTGRNRDVDTLTVRVGDHPAPITATAKYLLGEGEE